MRGRIFGGVFLLFGLVACGDDETSKPSNTNTNNSTTNNSTTNNSTTNNSKTNNSTTNNSNNNDSGVVLTELVDELHNVMCEAAWECLTGKNIEPLWTTYGRYPDVEACKAGPKTSIAWQLGIAQIVASAQSGRIDYDPALGRACVIAFKDALCNQETLELEPPPECLLALEGTVPLGENCVDSLECGTGNRCENMSMNGQCFGTCVQNVQVCGMSICLPTQYCDGSMCAQRTADFGACTTSETCLLESGCMNGTCTPLASLSEDQACDGSEYCAGGMICANGQCKTMTFGDLNATCGDGPNYCKAGLTCLVGGTVVGTCLPPLVEGASCNNTLQCENNLICDSTCKPPKADGTACTTHMECASLLCIGTCLPNEICVIPE